MVYSTTIPIAEVVYREVSVLAFLLAVLQYCNGVLHFYISIFVSVTAYMCLYFYIYIVLHIYISTASICIITFISLCVSMCLCFYIYIVRRICISRHLINRIFTRPAVITFV